MGLDQVKAELGRNINVIDRGGIGDNSSGQSNDNKGNQNAINKGNGEKKGLYKQLEGDSDDSWDGLLSTETTHYLNDGLNVMKEYGEHLEPMAQNYEANGSVVARKMFGNHERKIDTSKGNMTAKASGGLLYYMTDAIGIVMDMTDRTSINSRS